MSIRKIASTMPKVGCGKRKLKGQMLNVGCEKVNVHSTELEGRIRKLDYCLWKVECRKRKLECCINQSWMLDAKKLNRECKLKWQKQNAVQIMQSIMKNGTLNFWRKWHGTPYKRKCENVSRPFASDTSPKWIDWEGGEPWGISAPPKRGEPWKRIEGSWWGGDG